MIVDTCFFFQEKACNHGPRRKRSICSLHYQLQQQSRSTTVGLGHDRVSQIRVSIAIANSTAVALQTHCIQYERLYFPFFVEEVTEKVLA